MKGCRRNALLQGIKLKQHSCKYCSTRICKINMWYYIRLCWSFFPDPYPQLYRVSLFWRWFSFSVSLCVSPLPVVSSVADSCSILEEASPEAAYLYGSCVLAAYRADKKSFPAKTHCVFAPALTHKSLLFIYFSCPEEMSLRLGKVSPALPWRGPSSLCVMSACVFVH